MVIPTHSRPTLLARAVQACAGWPVLVVDDGPVPQAVPSGVWSVRTTGQVGFARAVNRGIRVAAERGHRAAVVLNDDAAPTPGSLQRLWTTWLERGGLLGPLLTDDADTPVSAGIDVARWGRIHERTSPQDTQPHAVPALSGACLVVGTSWRFDDRFRHGMEDIDLALRHHAAGAPVTLEPRAQCHHAGGATVDRRSARAQRAAVFGHLMLTGGGALGGVAVGLAVGQVLREGGSLERLRAVGAGVVDWRAAGAPRSQVRGLGHRG